MIVRYVALLTLCTEAILLTAGWFAPKSTLPMTPYDQLGVVLTGLMLALSLILCLLVLVAKEIVP